MAPDAANGLKVSAIPPSISTDGVPRSPARSFSDPMLPVKLRLSAETDHVDQDHVGIRGHRDRLAAGPESRRGQAGVVVLIDQGAGLERGLGVIGVLVVGERTARAHIAGIAGPTTIVLKRLSARPRVPALAS